MYYLRSRPATNAIKFTVDVEALINESCEGFELKHFNSKNEGERKNSTGVSTIEPEAEKPVDSKPPVKACPLRRRNANGEYDDEECLACGS